LPSNSAEPVPTIYSSGLSDKQVIDRVMLKSPLNSISVRIPSAFHLGKASRFYAEYSHYLDVDEVAGMRPYKGVKLRVIYS